MLCSYVLGVFLWSELLLTVPLCLSAALPRSVLVTALAGTCLVFGCFSAAALMAKRRSYLFLGGEDRTNF